MPVGGIDGAGGARDEQQHHADFDEDNQVVEIGGLFDADHQQRRDNENDDDCGQIKDRGDVGQGGGVGSERADLVGEVSAEGRPAGSHFQPRRQRGRQINQLSAARCCKLGRHYNAKVAQERDDVARPAHRDCNRADGVFENQVPANDPGKEFAQRGVAVSVGAAGHRHQRGELAVAQRRKDRCNAGQHERKHHGRAGVLRGHRARQHKDARADDRPNPQGGEVHGAERAFQTVVSQCLGLQVGNIFSSEQVHGLVARIHALVLAPV